MIPGIERAALDAEETRARATRACVCVPSFPCGITIVANVVSRECATRDRRLRLVPSSDLYATVSLRRPISRRRRDGVATASSPRFWIFCSTDGPSNWPSNDAVNTRILIDYVARARDELENYARSKDALGESLPSIGRAASKSSLTPVRCRSFQRFCKARLHRRFFFFFLRESDW